MRDVVDMALPAVAASPPALRGERVAGAVLLRGGPLAGLGVGVLVLSAAVLVPAGLWRPVVVLPVLMVGLAVAWRLCLLVPVRPVPAWSAALSVLAGVGEAGWAVATHAEHLILRRDPGSYALYAQWIATHNGLPVDPHLGAFGGSAALDVPGFTLGSPAYYQVLHGGGADIVPQFLVGAPAVFSLGWWLDGWPGLLAAPAVVAGLAVFAVAGLAARLVGPRWAPLAAVALAVAFPLLHAARSTYSEPLALLLVMTAAALIVDATGSAGTAAGIRPGALALVGGLTLGLTGLVRVDALTEIALLLPVATLLVLRRHPASAWLLTGALAGTVLAAGSALLLARPYLRTISGSLIPLIAGTAALGVACGLVLLLTRWCRTGRAAPAPGPARTSRPAAAVGWAAAALVLLAGVALATRPLWQIVRQSPGDPGAAFVASLQKFQHLPVDGARTYAEWSLAWVAWWVGPVGVLAAWLGFAVLARRAVHWLLRHPGAGGTPAARVSAAPAWLVPAVVGFASSMLTLWRPGITPDHPWADRRLVPVLLPTFVLAATGVTAWAVRAARRRLPATLLVLAAVTGCVALVAPPLLATAPMAAQRTEAGELGAVATVCAALRPGDVVVAVDNRGFNEWPQVIRGVCGHPAATLQDAGTPLPPDRLRASVTRLSQLVGSAGGRLVLLGAGEDQSPDQVLRGLGLDPQQVVHLVTSEDDRQLVSPPRGGFPLVVTVWLARWPG
ncbi:MAG TPA: hypothetical protein VFP72_11910 [Kineosporiaceae bacterium]|nr:hypothetical protein [Kineosporiaceae bacterium]